MIISGLEANKMFFSKSTALLTNKANRAFLITLYCFFMT